ncbi:hypothetical protein ACQ86O_23105 [Serratia sp. L9]|uniref:hypothetical protein n=1 Tax=Serratia sp. L9 TaxID=3423946 RepID=UPI003D67A91B
MCTYSEQKNGDYSYIAQKVNVSYGDVINIEFDMKGVGADVGQNGGEFYIKAYNSSGDIFDTYSHQEKTGNFDWKKINFQYAIPHEAKQLTIGFSAGRENIGSVIFDNLRVRKYTIGEKIVSSDNLNRKSELSKGLISNNNFFDLDGYLIKDGKRFFPLGVFVTNSSTDDFKKISDAGFNTILSYSIPAASNVDDFFLQAKNNNLSVIFSLKDMYKGMKWAPSFSSDPEKLVSYIDLIKVQDNLLAWYINDELPVTRISEVKNLYSIVRSRDESHPILQVVYRTAIARFFLEYTDIIAADVYPVGVRKDLSVTYDMAKDLDDIVRNNRKIKTSWFIPQIMDWGVYRKDFLSYPPVMRK